MELKKLTKNIFTGFIVLLTTKFTVKKEKTMHINRTGAQPNFGMARLSAQGKIAARAFVDDLPKFTDARVYKKKNMFKKLLNSVLKGTAQSSNIDEFLKQGQTTYATLNRQFVDKQLLTLGGRSSIKRFLNADHQNAAKIIADKTQKVPEDALSDTGTALVKSLLAIFDSNISNPEISARKCKSILNMINKYLPVDEFAKRTAVVSEKFLSR